MRMLLIGRGKMGTLIQQTAQAAGDEVVAALGREDLGQLCRCGPKGAQTAQKNRYDFSKSI